MDQPAAGFEANIVRRKLKITDRLPNNESNDAQGEIARLHVAAHDLRNPISGILSASEFLLEDLPDAREEHIACYGPENDLRLTGLHETAAIDDFTYGVADRGASIRIPHSFVSSGHRGYLEDRRPNSLADPYRITGRILQTIGSVTAQALIEDAFAA